MKETRIREHFLLQSIEALVAVPRWEQGRELSTSCSLGQSLPSLQGAGSSLVGPVGQEAVALVWSGDPAGARAT